MRHLAGSFGSHLSSERRALARALEAGATRGRPRQRVALAIGDGDDGVVEARVNVGDTFGHVLLDLLANLRQSLPCLGS
jgi:hypothetical protein